MNDFYHTIVGECHHLCSIWQNEHGVNETCQKVNWFTMKYWNYRMPSQGYMQFFQFIIRVVAIKSYTANYLEKITYEHETNIKWIHFIFNMHSNDCRCWHFERLYLCIEISFGGSLYNYLQSISTCHSLEFLNFRNYLHSNICTCQKLFFSKVSCNWSCLLNLWY